MTNVREPRSRPRGAIDDSIQAEAVKLLETDTAAFIERTRRKRLPFGFAVGTTKND